MSAAPELRLFVDANVIVYAVSEGPAQAASHALLDGVASGQIDGTTSVTVLEEVWHLELSGRVTGLAGQTRRARILFDELLAVGPRTLDLALALEAPADLGANDRLHVAACIEHEIGLIASADRAFDAVEGIERLDPLDPAMLDRLGGG